ncbi:MAG: hypothetical protein ACN6P5_19845 [Pseudomonas protegens]
MSRESGAIHTACAVTMRLVGGELFKQIGQIQGVDPRLLVLAKTNQQRGFK